MRFPKKALSMITCVVMVLSLTVISYADTCNSVKVTDKDLGISENYIVPATPGIVQSDGEPNTPGGVLVQSKNNQVSPLVVPPPELDNINITSRYDGYIDRGDVAEGTNNKPLGSGNDTLSVAFSHTVSNTISVGGKFPIDKVEATVGYSGSWSDTRTFSYAATVPPQTTVYVGYQDLYHVQKYDWSVQTWVVTGWVTTGSGSGWAQQWYSYHFYSHY